MILKPDTFIISFDPGRTTGVVVAHYYGKRHFDIVRVDEIRWQDRFETTRDIVFSYRNHLSAIIIEDFRLRRDLAEKQAGDDMPSSQIIGIIETYAFNFGIINLTRKQMPGVKNRVSILDRHFPAIGRSEHIKDAYQHIRYFIVSELSKNGGWR